MKHSHQGTVAMLCCCILFSAPTLCAAEGNKPDATVQSGLPAQGTADKANEVKPAGAEEAKKKSASDDEPGCNN